MKKLAALFLALLIVGGTVLSGQAQRFLLYAAEISGSVLNARDQSFRLPGEVTAFSLEADPEITAPITLTDAGQIAAISTLLDGSLVSSGQPSVAGQRLLSLGLKTADQTLTYDLFAEQDDLLLYSGQNWYILDQEKFFSLAAGIDGFYRHGEHPRALLKTLPSLPGQPLPVTQSSFAHQGLDGRMILSAPADTQPLTVPDWGRNRLPAIEFSQEPASAQAVVTLERAEVFRGPLSAAGDLHLLPNKSYQIEVIAHYQGAGFGGIAHFTYTLRTNELPTHFEISAGSTDLGEALVLRAHNLPPDGAVQATTSLSRTPTFSPDGQGGGVALLPVSIHTAPGAHFVELRAGGVTQRFPITVLDTEFAVQRFTIDQSVADQTVNSAQANAQFREVIHPLRQVGDSVIHWQGRFTRPVEGGRITTPFAVRRYVNGSGPTRHAAIDIALPQGTPVYAPAGGRVLFAGYLQLTGNTVVIEHGLGLKTWYYHMVSLDVQTGDMVGGGQQIGAVGSTGFSTGPHLHYEMSVYDVPINPDTAKLTDLFNFS